MNACGRGHKPRPRQCVGNLQRDGAVDVFDGHGAARGLDGLVGQVIKIDGDLFLGLQYGEADGAAEFADFLQTGVCAMVMLVEKTETARARLPVDGVEMIPAAMLFPS